jgi:uncharacterized protein
VRIVISGGTGFVGRSLAHTLVARGEDVVVLTRGEARLPTHACQECKNGGRIELAQWTPEHAGDWSDIVDGADAVIHLAGAAVVDGRWTDERKEVLRASRIVSTDLIARAMARAKNKPRVFVSASATGYYGARMDDAVLTESDSPGNDFLAVLCKDWEAAAQPARDAGVRTCHPRIGIVLGKNGGALAKMIPPFRAFVGGPIGEGRQYLPWIHVRDVVRAIEHALDRPLEGPFNVTAPEPVTMDAFAEAIGRALKRPAAMRVPAFALRIAMGEAADVVLTGQRAIPRKLVDDSFAFVFPELDSALADLV